ncbi:MAG: hypothetical protein JW700_02845 [Candidatus Aenigmarchaeota archaeon]|nr:hypothetical protein [Candidatus Aenigmarchaeota archaeon]
MVNVKKFLLIPVLIILYVIFINFISQLTPSSAESEQSMSGGTAQTLGMGDSISVSVTRAYFFGFVRLPVYSAMFGDISIMHDMFSYFIAILTVIFIIQEVKYNKKRRGVKMAKKTIGIDWKYYLMPILMGLVFWFIMALLTLDNTMAVMIGLLVTYLEYKLRK